MVPPAASGGSSSRRVDQQYPPLPDDLPISVTGSPFSRKGRIFRWDVGRTVKSSS
jgi:hypothetical protein